MRVRAFLTELRVSRTLLNCRRFSQALFDWNVYGQMDTKPIEWHGDKTAVLETPQISTRDIATIVRGRTLEELLSLVMALINQDKLELAESFMSTISRNMRNEWGNYRDVGLANSFLRSYLVTGRLSEAARWKKLIFNRKHFEPDALTYAILFKFYLERDSLGEIRGLRDELGLDGMRMEQVLELEYFSETERSKLQQITKLPSASVESSIDINIDEAVGHRLLENGFAANEGRGLLELFPEVSAIKSKSGGISFLKEALRILQNDPQANLYTVQEKLEKDCYQATSQRFRTEIENYQKATKNTVFGTNLKKLIIKWQGELMAEIRTALTNSTTTRLQRSVVSSASGIFYSALLSSMEVDKITFIVLQELVKLSSYDVGTGGITVSKLAISIGQNLEREMFASQISRFEFLQHTRLKAFHLTKIFRNRGVFEKTMRAQYAALDRNIEALRAGWIPRWPSTLKAEIGVFLLSIAIDNLKFNDCPAFTHRIIFHGRDKLGIITPTDALLKLLGSESATFFIDPWAMPMLVPPRPWLTSNSGGYLTQRMLCVRTKDDPVHLAMIQQADKSGSLQSILHGLDVLGKTPWRINEKILTIALELWNSGVNVATLEKPPETTEQMEFKSKEQFVTHEEFVKYVKEAVERKEALGRAHSAMCDTNYKLEIARQFVGIPFYLPHTVDFRGRAYPIPPHLSHIGSDLSRGLIVFAEGKPLGERGLRWLKIQLANTTGFDKASLDDRVAFADAHKDDIFDSADNPLTGNSWWRRADEPWQCLATCIELAAAWRGSDPTQYISHLPCQQDGSCNGLQHYAALGGDVDGATQVNLAPGPRPADVYSAVAKLVSARIKEDAMSDPTHIANKLVDKINRKIVKQTVMTNVYGVTIYGARQQIEDRLREFRIVSPEDYKATRNYITELVFKSLGTLFDKAQQIQEWLSDTAEEIARAVPPEVAAKFGSRISESGQFDGTKELDPADRYPQTSVCWTTPLGFQVLQPYNRQKTIQLRTVLQSLSLRVSSKFDPVDINKQSSAFPPNFVHSLDATHMFKTALACHEAGITFASVHDCFWTHAATVDLMNRTLREQFVDMHKKPILSKLYDEFIQRYRGYLIPEGISRNGESNDIRYFTVNSWRPINISPIPPKDGFDINLVLQSEYFFS